MGVLNVTPDSFSDGGNFFSQEKAVHHALQMERDGADLIDIGAESTRPGSLGINAQEEWSRLVPVLAALRTRLKIPISIDTRKSEIAAKAIESGAEIINDVSGLKHDPRVAEISARARVPLVLMHMRGGPQTMQQKPFARDALKDVSQGLRASLSIARKAGVANSQIILDPGIGFGKSYAQNYELLAELPQLAKLGFPLLVGTSRKGFISKTLAQDEKLAPSPQPAGIAAEKKIWGTAATVTASILQGAHIVRVHDVAEMVSVVRIADCILNPTLAPKN
ncbi:MAG TPA: dihydropteroate synthase [Verrucomicrobiae bacterium]|nr:dihydropteroate synthase [Verrucomicrobiae bacterium]